MSDNKIEFLPSNVAACCSESKTMLEGCANGVSYVVLICDSDCGETTSMKYLNLATGQVEATAPAGFSLGQCTNADRIDSNICFEFTENNATVSIRVATVNGVVYYYENGVQVTNSTRMTEIEALLANATASNVVCCSDCQTIPDGQVCYSLTSTKTYQAAEAIEIAYGVAGVPLYIPSINIRNIASDTYVDTITFSPALQIWNGSTYISATALASALNGANYLAKWQAVDPRFDRFEVVAQSGGGPRVYLIDDADGYTLATRIANNDWDTSTSSTGSPLADTIRDGAFTNVELGSTTVTYKVVTANGVTEYYKDDVLLTTADAITEAQDAIATAQPSDIICCPDCGGGSDVTVTDTITGHKIATVTVDGTAYPINETVTSIETNADGSFTYTDEAGEAHIIPVSPCKSFYEKQTFTATAGQTTFTLLTAPSGDVHFSRNGSTLNDLAATVSGSTVTYVPNQNNNEALLAGDRIDISYVYTICSGTATVADGSETKVIAGTNTTITGTGTIADPYIVSATGGSTAGIGDFGVLVSNSGQAVSGGTTIDMIGPNQVYGTNVVPSAATNTLLLKAGYIYEVDVQLQMAFANSGSFFNYALYSGTTAASQTNQFGTPGKVRPNTETFANGMFDVNAQGFVVATVDTYVSVKGTNGNGTTQNYENATYFKAKAIGKI